MRHTMKPTITLDVTSYLRNNGCPPRGHGAWSFRAEFITYTKRTNPRTRKVETCRPFGNYVKFFQHTGLWSEARQAFTEWAKVEARDYNSSYPLDLMVGEVRATLNS